MKQYYIKDDYVINSTIHSAEEMPADGPFWNEHNVRLGGISQYYVYKLAYKVATTNGLTSVLDIGCGTGRLLGKFFEKGFTIYGVDQPSSIPLCQKSCPQGTFVVDNIEQPTHPLKQNSGSAQLIICADIIEHLADPDNLLDYIRFYANKDTLVIISTPERDSLRGKNCVKPGNRYHVREWNFQEFSRYIASSGFQILEHRVTLSNKVRANLDTVQWFLGKTLRGLPIRHTQVVIAKVL